MSLCHRSVPDTDTLCHTACARGLNHPLHSASQSQSHPAVARTPTSSAAQRLTGPPRLPEVTIRYGAVRHHRRQTQLESS